MSIDIGDFTKFLISIDEEKRLWKKYDRLMRGAIDLSASQIDDLIDKLGRASRGEYLTPSKKRTPRQPKPKPAPKPGIQKTMTLGGEPFQYFLKRSKRKTIGFQVARGVLTVTIPFFTSIAATERTIEANRAWIERALAKTKLSKPSKTQDLWKSAWSSRSIQVVGIETPVKIEFSSVRRRPYYDENSNIFYYYSSEGVTETLVYRAALDFVKYWAHQYLTDMTRQIASQDPFLVQKLKKVKITNANTRWGSCSALGNVNLSWKLVLTEKKLCEYVVVHELCHLYHLNHSSAFWEKVLEKCPDAMTCRQLLRNFNIVNPLE